jgi:hypothetical protein
LDNIGFTRLGFSLPPELQFKAIHKDESSPRAWEKYPEAQLASAQELCKVLIATYPTITEIVGHDDIAPRRKTDPGPAFPMADFRRGVFSDVDTQPLPPVTPEPPPAPVAGILYAVAEPAIWVRVAPSQSSSQVGRAMKNETICAADKPIGATGYVQVIGGKWDGKFVWFGYLQKI